MCIDEIAGQEGVKKVRMEGNGSETSAVLL